MASNINTYAQADEIVYEQVKNSGVNALVQKTARKVGTIALVTVTFVVGCVLGAAGQLHENAELTAQIEILQYQVDHPAK